MRRKKKTRKHKKELNHQYQRSLLIFLYTLKAIKKGMVEIKQVEVLPVFLFFLQISRENQKFKSFLLPPAIP